MSENENLPVHAHVSEYGTDCDGAHGHEYVALMNDSERAEHEAGVERGFNNFAEYSFKERILGGAVSWSPLVEVRVIITEDGFETYETTDEGMRSREVRWCTDADCDPDAGSVYDQYAELAGY